MYHNYFFLKRLTSELTLKLSGATLAECFSQNKEELILGFSIDRKDFFLKANLEPKVAALYFTDTFHRARRNSVDLFGSVINQKVTGVTVYENERSFKISFTNHQYFIFKMHGSRSNILLCQDDAVTEAFRGSLANDLSLVPSSLPRKVPLTLEEFQGAGLAAFPHFGKEVLEYYFHAEETPEITWGKIRTVQDQLLNNPVSICLEAGTPPLLLLFKGSRKPDFESQSAIEASNFYFEKLVRFIDIDLRKSKLVQELHTSIKRSKSYISKNEQKLTELLTRRSYTELGNLVMANLHLFTNGVHEAEVQDFYTGSLVNLKIKAGVSPQAYAESLYRKGKNQSLEIRTLEENTSKKKLALSDLEERLTNLIRLDDPGLLKDLTAGDAAGEKDEPLPYFKFSFRSYDILVGKNAGSNDHLTQRVATKNDLWLHARDTPGSHVIIKNKPGTNFPAEVVEKAAQLAAWNSKRKGETLCPVIYTEKKYVRKIKGALPGQVHVEKEKIMMVKPEPFEASVSK